MATVPARQRFFAGAVKDYGIGTLVGTTTYGKGIVQELFSFEDDTMIKITTAEYFYTEWRKHP